MEYLSIIMAIISLVASLVTLFAVWGNISNYIYNLKNFKDGGVRITQYSGEYKIYSGFCKNLLYKSSDNKDAYICYRGDGRTEQYEEIKCFREWSMAHKFHDIRVPNYPIRLLKNRLLISPKHWISAKKYYLCSTKQNR